MNKCNNIIKTGLNKGNLCNRNIPCKYHSNNLVNNLEKKYENNPKDYQSMMGLFFMSEKQYNEYSHPNNYHPDKHTLDWMF